MLVLCQDLFFLHILNTFMKLMKHRFIASPLRFSDRVVGVLSFNDGSGTPSGISLVLVIKK